MIAELMAIITTYMCVKKSNHLKGKVNHFAFFYCDKSDKFVTIKVSKSWRKTMAKQLTILVTGGAGFIGTNFIRLVYTLDPNVSFIVLDKLTYAGNRHNFDDLDEKRVRFVEGDVCDAPLVRKLVEQCDVVVHFAAESHNDLALIDANPFVQTNIIGTYTIIEACRQFDKRLHHVSTDEVYGSLALNDTQKKFHENSPYNPNNPYSATKASADFLVRAWIKTYQLRATISNCSNNYGPYQHVEKFLPRQITNLLNGDPVVLYGDGRHVRDWIHVTDHVRAIWEILNQGEIGKTYVIGVQTEKSNIEMVKLLLNQFGKDESDIKYVSDRQNHDVRYAIDSTDFYRDINCPIHYSDLEQGIVDTINWYRHHREWWETDKKCVENFYRSIEK